jgi:hypothetical protein
MGQTGPTGLQGPTGSIVVEPYDSVGGTGYIVVNGGPDGFTGSQYSDALMIGPSIQTVFGASGTTGSSSNPTIFVNADIIPTQDEMFSLGSRDRKFKTINLAANTIYLGTSFMSTDSAGNIVLTSSDGTSAVPSTNENFMVAVGTDSQCSIKYSTNATTWYNAISGPSGPTGSAPPFAMGRSVLWTGNFWVAGGLASGLAGGSSILKSTNGREWFSPAVTTDPFSELGQGVGVCLSLAYNASQDILVAVGDQGTGAYVNNYNHMFYSQDDGNTWTPINYPHEESKAATKVATDGKSTWYLIDIVDNYGVTFPYTSSDGINWVLGNYNALFTTNSIRYNGHYWLACGSNNIYNYDPNFHAITRSDDGINWTPVLNSIPDGVNVFNGSDIAWNGIYWVCVGQGAGSNVWISKDGNNWSQITDFVGVQLNTISWNGEVWVAGGAFPVTYDVNGEPINSTVSFIVSSDTNNWYSVSGAAFTGVPYATASRRILPFGGAPPGIAGGNRGPTGATGPAAPSIGFDGGNSQSTYPLGPAFDCGRAK